MRPPVIVVGAGVAGLACARTLHAAGVDVVVLDACDAVGGRVRTDDVEGFLLDRGFQILLTAYPEARRLLDYEKLELCRFYPGALVRLNGAFHRIANPLERPIDALGSLRGPLIRVADLVPLARLGLRARSSAASESRRETSTLEALRELGLSDRLIDAVFRPFLGGVFLDASLETTSRMLDFVLPMFAGGPAAVPAGGMGAIPAQLAAGLPEAAIRCSSPVSSVSSNEVVLAAGDALSARAVVVATDADTAASLMPELDAVPWRSASCLYFDAPRAPLEGPSLVLDGDGHGPVANLVVMSEVARTYAPAGSALISATVIGDAEQSESALQERVIEQLAEWFGPAVRSWGHLRTYRIDHALPAMSVPARPDLANPRLASGVYVCGDHRSTSSLQGAMRSGRLAAEQLLRE